MVEPREIELDRSGYRHVFTGPLSKPGGLWALLLVSLLGAVLCSWVAWTLGTFWAALFPIVPSLYVGIAIAGLVPQWWFRDGPGN